MSKSNSFTALLFMALCAVSLNTFFMPSALAGPEAPTPAQTPAAPGETPVLLR